MPYIPHTAEDIREMLKTIGKDSVEALFEAIPPEVRLREKYKIPQGLTETELWKTMQSLAAKNQNIDTNSSFLGAGVYDHLVPILVDYLSGRSEFWTSYTPYQPEGSQGNLQAIFEYQTSICELTGMDVANASMYDGATALAEAMLLAYHHHQEPKRTKILVAPGLHPDYWQVAKTYMLELGVELVVLPELAGVVDVQKAAAMINDQVAAVAIASPNFFGLIEDGAALATLAHKVGALMICAANPISLAILEPPGVYGADIAVGEGQPLGIPMSWGGLGFGFFGTREEHLRKMPGRLVGQTVDQDGKRGFVLTLQTREQHIRREKATSNICSNQALMALRGLIYMTTLGKQGMQDVARQCVQKSHYLAKAIQAIPGYSLSYPTPFFHEFVVKCPKPGQEIVNKLKDRQIFSGVPLSKWFADRSHELLLAATETVTREQMDLLVNELKAIQ